MDNDLEIKRILEENRTIAVVGLSRDTTKDSFKVAKYMKDHYYHIIPINPFVDEVLGEKCYKSLFDLPEELMKTVEVVDIFRPSSEVPTIMDQAIQLKEKYRNLHVVWMQLGIRNEEAAQKGRDAGLTVIIDRCIKIEHRKLIK